MQYPHICILVIIGLSKVVAFTSIHHAINLYVASSSKVVSEFDYVFLSNVLLFESMKLSL